jgi:16S rRNA (guanine966-N2)-methyltransferase
MRVISGIAKGLRLKSPGPATRPITDRVKESLFNILGVRVIDANVLDLFAGAGSVGIEALSRGARHATFVEIDREALRALGENLRVTRVASQATIVRAEVFGFIRHDSKGEYDLIYVAPPQYKSLWQQVLTVLDRRQFLTKDGQIVAQIHPKEFRELSLVQYEISDRRQYGSTMLCFYMRKPEA